MSGYETQHRDTQGGDRDGAGPNTHLDKMVSREVLGHGWAGVPGEEAMIKMAVDGGALGTRRRELGLQGAA